MQTEGEIAMVFLEMLGAAMILGLIILGIAKYSEFFKSQPKGE